jgi:DNA-binding transcriptional LysR family regulator
MRMAERGMGVAPIDSFTAAQADRRRVRIVQLQPAIPVRIYYLRAHRAQGFHAGRRFVETVAAAASKAHRAVAEER